MFICRQDLCNVEYDLYACMRGSGKWINSQFIIPIFFTCMLYLNYKFLYVDMICVSVGMISIPPRTMWEINFNEASKIKSRFIISDFFYLHAVVILHSKFLFADPVCIPVGTISLPAGTMHWVNYVQWRMENEVNLLSQIFYYLHAIFKVQCKFSYAGMICIPEGMISINTGAMCILAGTNCIPSGMISSQIPMRTSSHRFSACVWSGMIHP